MKEFIGSRIVDANGDEAYLADCSVEPLWTTAMQDVWSAVQGLRAQSLASIVVATGQRAEDGALVPIVGMHGLDDVLEVSIALAVVQVLQAHLQRGMTYAEALVDAESLLQRIGALVADHTWPIIRELPGAPPRA